MSDASQDFHTRLATLEERLAWHRASLEKLQTDLLDVASRTAHLEKDQARLALLEREIQYTTAALDRAVKHLEVLEASVDSLEVSDSSQKKTVGFIENLGSHFAMTLVGAAAAAIFLRLTSGVWG